MLIDGAPTHNFIYEGFVTKTSLQVEDFKGFKVANANRDKVVKKLGIKLEDHTVTDDFYVFPMGSSSNGVESSMAIFFGRIYSNY